VIKKTFLKNTIRKFSIFWCRWKR